jgi:predicted 3-demethylubiquinone-9 3-methyltransferase (glyoxalase superfamily)
MTTLTPFLMFEGAAGEAMDFYASLFPESRIDDVSRYGPGEQGAEGSVRLARFTLAGQSVLCIDSPVRHAFGFTPAFSFFVDCGSEEDQDRYAAALSEGGEWLMGLADYGFSRRFGWLNDRFGVSWQLNLP